MEHTTRTPVDHYTDDTLRATLADPTTMVGSRREAELLLTVPADARNLIVRDAWRARNAGAAGPRWSDALRQSIAAFERGTLTEQSFIDGKWWMGHTPPPPFADPDGEPGGIDWI